MVYVDANSDTEYSRSAAPKTTNSALLTHDGLKNIITPRTRVISGPI